MNEAGEDRTTLNDGFSAAEHQAQMDLVFNTTIDIIFLIAAEGNDQYRFVSANNSFVKVTGLPREAVEGKFIDEVIPEPSLSVVKENYRRAIHHQQTVQWEETTEYPTGKKTGIVSITPVINENGTCSMLVGTVHDITERKSIEEESKYVSYQLNERVKELTTLYRVGQLLQDEFREIDLVMQEVVDVLPPGWQYPSITEAKISIGDKEYKTLGYRSSEFFQNADFNLPGDENGFIEVVYLEAQSDQEEGPFLAEERKLINMLAEMLRNYFFRKYTADKLLKEKQLSESIINSLPGIFYLFDYTGKYLRWNKNHETVPGYTAEEMETMYPLNFFDVEDKQTIDERIMKVFTEGYADVEANFLTKDGKKIPYFFNGIAIDYEGRRCLMGVGVDVTERKKAAEQLQQAEIKFRTLVEKSQVGVYIVQNQKFVYVNPRFEEIFGYGPGELTGREPVSTIIMDEDQPMVREYARLRMERHMDSVHYECTGKRKDGSPNKVEFYGSYTIYDGSPTIIGTMIDITERKLAEEALQKTEANLQTIFRNTDTSYALLDADLRIISFNQRCIDFVRDELGGNIKLNDVFYSFFPPERQPLLFERGKRILAGEHMSWESNYPQQDGSYHWYSVRQFPVLDTEKKVLGLMIAVNDITETKLLEQQIVNQKVQAQKTVTRAVLNAQEKERNNIGQELHDNVNQILVGAKMYMGLMKELTGENQELIRKSIDLLDNGINEIRSISREQVTPQRKVDLKALIQSLIDNLRDQSEINTQFTDDAELLDIDDELKLNIYRIVQECINNIIKHANAHNVTVLLHSDSEGLQVLITDDGKGFDKGEPQGRGVGLNNILNRVESYNGQINIDSSKGKGCRIELSFPLY